MSDVHTYPVPDEWAKKAWIDSAKYDEMYKRSIDDPEGFWAEQAEKSATATGKVTVCFVRAGATNANSDLGLAKAIMPILANNFPERLDRVLVYPTGIGYRAA